MKKLTIVFLIIPLMLMTMKANADKGQHDIIDDLIPHIILAESGGRLKAVSRDGCRGICQLSRAAWKEVMDVPYIPNVYNPKLNKIACKRYLILLKKRLGKHYTLERLLGSYNMGLAKLKRLNYQWWRIRETRNYVRKIKGHLQKQ